MHSLLSWAVGLLCIFSLKLGHVFERFLRWFTIPIHTIYFTRRAPVVRDSIPVPCVITGPADPVPLVTQELLASHTQTHVDYQDNREKLNSKCQVLWNEWMKEGGLCTPSFYRKVEVLLVTWDDDWTDLDTKEEVRKLEKVFKDTFRYTVSRVLLNCKNEQVPQQQIFFELSKFVVEKDGPNTLFIIYYAGHGVPGIAPGRLNLSGKRFPSEDPEEVGEIVWNHAEVALQYTKADVLQIFDCCYAGDLGRNGGFRRSSEFLAATSSGSTTRGPGEHSFTSALIWALEKLAKDSTKFTASMLADKIKDCPRFPQDQNPVLSERNAARVERIIISALPKDGHPTEPVNELNVQDGPHRDHEILELKFVFQTRPGERQLKLLADGLHRTIKHEEDLQINRVVWAGLHSDTLHECVHRAVERFKGAGKKGRERRTSNVTAPPSPLAPSSPLSLFSHESPSIPSSTTNGSPGRNSPSDNGRPPSVTSYASGTQATRTTAEGASSL